MPRAIAVTFSARQTPCSGGMTFDRAATHVDRQPTARRRRIIEHVIEPRGQAAKLISRPPQLARGGRAWIGSDVQPTRPPRPHRRRCQAAGKLIIVSPSAADQSGPDRGMPHCNASAPYGTRSACRSSAAGIRERSASVCRRRRVVNTGRPRWPALGTLGSRSLSVPGVAGCGDPRRGVPGRAPVCGGRRRGNGLCRTASRAGVPSSPPRNCRKVVGGPCGLVCHVTGVS